ncbi:hypothetical protein BDF14DRAFT_1939804 [Spinellus fusiger]|nr:hypothetical protein BDF14DRAFT_1939804 [Spinellus fusiger]
MRVLDSNSLACGGAIQDEIRTRHFMCIKCIHSTTDNFHQVVALFCFFKWRLFYLIYLNRYSLNVQETRETDQETQEQTTTSPTEHNSEPSTTRAIRPESRKSLRRTPTDTKTQAKESRPTGTKKPHPDEKRTAHQSPPSKLWLLCVLNSLIYFG